MNQDEITKEIDKQKRAADIPGENPYPGQTGFDFDGWKSSGEQAYEELRKRKVELSAELEEVEKQIAGIEGILGKKTTARRKIRPVLKRHLKGAGEGLSIKDLVTATAAELGVDPKSVESALHRWAAKDDKVIISHHWVSMDTTGDGDDDGAQE